MRSRLLITLAVVSAACAFAQSAPSAAAARTAYDAGLHQARKRGIADPGCYASVFQTYASLNRYGHWSVRRARSRDNGFQLELFSKCHIAV